MKKSIQSSALPTTQQGFTLIEVMVVIVILGILAALVVPSVMGSGDKARIGTTKSALSTTANALDMYRLDNHKYPSTAEGLAALAHPPATAKNAPAEGYVKGGTPKDGWGNELQYVSPGMDGKPYTLFSFGGDGKEGGEGTDADILLEQ